MRPTTISAAGKLVTTQKSFNRKRKANQKLSLETQHNKINNYFQTRPRGKGEGAKGLAISEILTDNNSYLTNPKGQDNLNEDMRPGEKPKGD